MKHTHMQRLRQTAGELETISARLKTIAEVLERDNPDSGEARHLRVAADYIGNSMGSITRALGAGKQDDGATLPGRIETPAALDDATIARRATMRASIRLLVEAIERDEQLSSWARYSIRYNDQREQQARDFMSKLTANGRPIPGITLAATKAALVEIDRTGKEN